MTKLTLTLASLALALSSGALRAEPAAPANPPAAHQEAHSELEEQMETMRSAFGKLRKQVGDASLNASSLELAAKLKKAAEASAALTPARAAKVPEAERAKFVEGYQAGMKTFVAEVEKLEAALKASDNTEAAAIVAKLGAMQKDGHKDYRAQKKKE